VNGEGDLWIDDLLEAWRIPWNALFMCFLGIKKRIIFFFFFFFFQVDELKVYLFLCLIYFSLGNADWRGEIVKTKESHRDNYNHKVCVLSFDSIQVNRQLEKKKNRQKNEAFHRIITGNKVP